MHTSRLLFKWNAFKCPMLGKMLISRTKTIVHFNRENLKQMKDSLPVLNRQKNEISAYLMDESTEPSEILKNLTPEDAERLKYIQEEYKILLYSSQEQVPSVMTDESWLHLLRSASSSRRFQAYRYLYSKFCTNLASHLPKPIKEMTPIEFSEPPSNFTMTFGKLPLRTEMLFCYLSAMQFSQAVVVDHSYDDHMAYPEQKSLLRQLIFIMGANRCRDPFYLIYAGVQANSVVHEGLQRSVACGDTEFTRKNLTVTSNSLTDLFDSELAHHDRQNLLFLTPHSPNTLKQGEWDPSWVLVIGGLVDKSDKRPHTLHRALKLGCRHARFPMLGFTPGKSRHVRMTLVDVFSILYIARATGGDWKRAIQETLRISFNEEKAVKSPRVFLNH